jgi:hypothetical protein
MAYWKPPKIASAPDLDEFCPLGLTERGTSTLDASFDDSADWGNEKAG